MAEAIGLAASIIQIAGAGLSLSQALYNYADGVSSADKRAKEIAQDVRLTSAVIQELGDVFKREDTSGVVSSSAVGTAKKAVVECHGVFDELNAMLQKAQRRGIGRLSWPFRENKFLLLRANLDRLKSTLALLMQVLIHAHQVHTNKEDKSEILRQREELKRLIKAKKSSIQRYEIFLARASSSDDSTLIDNSGVGGKQANQNVHPSHPSLGRYAMNTFTRIIPDDYSNTNGQVDRHLDLSDEDEDTTNASTATTSVGNGGYANSRITNKSLALCIHHIQTLLGHIATAEVKLDQNSRTSRAVIASDVDLRNAYGVMRNALDGIIGLPEDADTSRFRNNARPKPRQFDHSTEEPKSKNPGSSHIVDSDAEYTEEDYNKRLKASQERSRLACKQCRRTNFKCDGKYPRCGKCVDEDIVCDFEFKGPPRKSDSNDSFARRQSEALRFETEVRTKEARRQRQRAVHREDHTPTHEFQREQFGRRQGDERVRMRAHERDMEESYQYSRRRRSSWHRHPEAPLSFQYQVPSRSNPADASHSPRSSVIQDYVEDERARMQADRYDSENLRIRRPSRRSSSFDANRELEKIREREEKAAMELAAVRRRKAQQNSDENAQSVSDRYEARSPNRYSLSNRQNEIRVPRSKGRIITNSIGLGLGKNELDVRRESQNRSRRRFDDHSRDRKYRTYQQPSDHGEFSDWALEDQMAEVHLELGRERTKSGSAVEHHHRNPRSSPSPTFEKPVEMERVWERLQMKEGGDLDQDLMVVGDRLREEYQLKMEKERNARMRRDSSEALRRPLLIEAPPGSDDSVDVLVERVRQRKDRSPRPYADSSPIPAIIVQDPRSRRSGTASPDLDKEHIPRDSWVVRRDDEDLLKDEQFKMSGGLGFIPSTTGTKRDDEPPAGLLPMPEEQLGLDVEPDDHYGSNSSLSSRWSNPSASANDESFSSRNAIEDELDGLLQDWTNVKDTEWVEAYADPEDGQDAASDRDLSSASEA